MWEAFKRELFERIHKYIPRVNNFSSWKKDSWERPLDKSLRKKLHTRIDYGQDTSKHAIRRSTKNTKKFVMQSERKRVI